MGFSINLPQNSKIELFWEVLMQPTLSTLKNLPHVPHHPQTVSPPHLTLPTTHHKSVYVDQMHCYDGNFFGLFRLGSNLIYGFST